jgi:molecular chaperone GrpE
MTEKGQDPPGPPEAAAGAPASPPPPPPPADVEQLAAERDRLNDQFLRAKAELANVLKRAEREREQAALRVRRDFVKALLPALDALELAIKHGAEGSPALLDGLKAARDALAKALASQGAERIPAEPGQGFDPDLHHVQGAVERAEVPDGTILEEIRPGYRVGKLVARHGEVMVSKRPGPQKSAPAEKAGPDA